MTNGGATEAWRRGWTKPDVADGRDDPTSCGWNPERDGSMYWCNCHPSELRYRQNWQHGSWQEVLNWKTFRGRKPAPLTAICTIKHFSFSSCGCGPQGSYLNLMLRIFFLILDCCAAQYFVLAYRDRILNMISLRGAKRYLNVCS